MSETKTSQAAAREWFGLAILAQPTLLVSMDLFVMLLAIPRLSEARRVSSVQQLWIIDVYGFIMAGFSITMGTLGDRIGRRKLLLMGAAAFGVASLLAAFSSSPGVLIAARALLGVAGAAMTPSTLALISTLFQGAIQRTTAFGIWAGCFTVGRLAAVIYRYQLSFHPPVGLTDSTVQSARESIYGAASVATQLPAPAG